MATSNNAATHAAFVEKVAGRVGDGSTVTAEQFRGMGYAERAKLHDVNPEAYARLGNAEAGDA